MNDNKPENEREVIDLAQEAHVVRQEARDRLANEIQIANDLTSRAYNNGLAALKWLANRLQR